MNFVLKPFRNDLRVTRLANIHYFEFTPNYHTDNHPHDFCELVYVDKGNIEVLSDHFKGNLRQNEMIIHGATENHTLRCYEKDAPNIIIIGFECKSPALSALTKSPLLLTEELQKMLSEIIKEARSVYLPPYNVPNVKNMKKRKEFTFGADQLIKNYLQIFLIKCIRITATPHTQRPQQKKQAVETPRIYEIKEYLEQNYLQKITLKELCFLFNTNKTSLSSHFKQEFHKTVVEYLTQLRIEHVKLLLREGRYSLTQIADAMNLSSVHYLTNLFKKSTGMSPTEYLHTLRENLR